MMDMFRHLEAGIKHFWWVAPTYQQAKIAFNILDKALKHIAKVNRSELKIEIFNEITFEFKSAERPDNLRGFGLEYLVMDEAAHIDERVWHDVLRPALADKQGKLLAISTPNGQNWFYQLWLRGQNKEGNYASWQMPTMMNPYIKPEEIEELRRSLPERVFKQEIEAQFIEGASSVFRHIDECIKQYTVPCNPSGGVVLGVDLAKYEDFTVIIAMDETGRVIDFDRFNNLDWEIQKARIIDKARKYRAKVVLDSTGVGDPIFEDLRKSGINVEGYKFTHESKQKLINSLSIAIESQTITLPYISELITELKAYEYRLTNSGKVVMNAPAGHHDDCVIALALAVWGSRTQRDATVLDKSDWGVW
jgi:phage FluMu gp28-like protein